MGVWVRVSDLIMWGEGVSNKANHKPNTSPYLTLISKTT